jgi:hypothetical protein
VVRIARARGVFIFVRIFSRGIFLRESLSKVAAAAALHPMWGGSRPAATVGEAELKEFCVPLPSILSITNIGGAMRPFLKRFSES